MDGRRDRSSSRDRFGGRADYNEREMLSAQFDPKADPVEEMENMKNAFAAVVEAKKQRIKERKEQNKDEFYDRIGIRPVVQTEKPFIKDKNTDEIDNILQTIQHATRGKRSSSLNRSSPYSGKRGFNMRILVREKIAMLFDFPSLWYLGSGKEVFSFCLKMMYRHARKKKQS